MTSRQRPAKRVLFVEPPPFPEWTPAHVESTAGRRHPSLNVTGERVYSYLNLSAAAVLRERGIKVEYVHCQTMGVDLDGLGDIIVSFGPGFVVVMAEHINLSTADLVAQNALESGATPVFVGPLATALDTEFARKLSCRYIIRGEWDLTLAHLVEALSAGESPEKVAGLTYLANGAVVRTPDAPRIDDLDSLPIPAYELLDLSKFYESVFVRFPAATMITSRGCPFRCVFCAFPNTIYSHGFRAMSPGRVLAEVKYLVKDLGVREIRFDDDTFEIDRKRALEICGLLRSERLDLDWLVQCRPSLLDPELAGAFRAAGCVMVLFGVESGDDGILRKIRKSTTTEEIRRGMAAARQAGLEVLNCIMLGFYWDTPETLEKSLDFACELNAEFTQFSIPTPLPGTEYYDFLKDEGILEVRRWEDFDSFHRTRLKLPHLDSGEINEFLKRAYRRYYLRPRYALMMLRRAFSSPAHFRQTLRLFSAFLMRRRKGWI